MTKNKITLIGILIIVLLMFLLAGMGRWIEHATLGQEGTIVARIIAAGIVVFENTVTALIGFAAAIAGPLAGVFLGVTQQITENIFGYILYIGYVDPEPLLFIKRFINLPLIMIPRFVIFLAYGFSVGLFWKYFKKIELSFSAKSLLIYNAVQLSSYFIFRRLLPLTVLSNNFRDLPHILFAPRALLNVVLTILLNIYFVYILQRRGKKTA